MQPFLWGERTRCASKTLDTLHQLPLSLQPARVAGQSPCGGGGEVLIGGGLIVEVEGCCEMVKGFVCLSGNLSEIMFHGGIGDPT